MDDAERGSVLVALGGNAILKHTEQGTAEEQRHNIGVTATWLVEMIKHGFRIAITHGNGPQVGDILLKNEIAKGTLPPMPIDVCGAESQGLIGYFLQQTMHNELVRQGLNLPVATVLSQCIVGEDDPALKDPSKPIGPFYTVMEASKLREERGWTMIDDSGRGWRRVVPSPKPVSIVGQVIKNCMMKASSSSPAAGAACPWCGKGDRLKGIEAVIDKDHTASALARLIGADAPNLTDVEGVYARRGRRTVADGS